jgi:hypothetical protein
MKQATHFTVQPGWKILISDMGINPTHVLAFAELPADLFSRKDTRLTPGEYFRLWHGLEQAAGTEDLPLKIGRAISVEAFDPPNTSYFGKSIRPGKAVCIAFSAQDAVSPFLTENRAMWDFFEAGLNKRLSDLDAESSTVQRVKSALLEMLPSGRSSIEETAGRLAMSKRSLQR